MRPEKRAPVSLHDAVHIGRSDHACPSRGEIPLALSASSISACRQLSSSPSSQLRHRNVRQRLPSTDDHCDRATTASTSKSMPSSASRGTGISVQAGLGPEPKLCSSALPKKWSFSSL